MGAQTGSRCIEWTSASDYKERQFLESGPSLRLFWFGNQLAKANSSSALQLAQILTTRNEGNNRVFSQIHGKDKIITIFTQCMEKFDCWTSIRHERNSVLLSSIHGSQKGLTSHHLLSVYCYPRFSIPHRYANLLSRSNCTKLFFSENSTPLPTHSPLNAFSPFLHLSSHEPSPSPPPSPSSRPPPHPLHNLNLNNPCGPLPFPSSPRYPLRRGSPVRIPVSPPDPTSLRARELLRCDRHRWLEVFVCDGPFVIVAGVCGMPF